MPIIASFNELDGLDAMLPWAGLSFLALLLGLAGVVLAAGFKRRARLAVKLGIASCVLELLGLFRVFTDPWHQRRFQSGHPPDFIFLGICVLILAIGGSAVYFGRRRLAAQTASKKTPDEWTAP